jgi:hypothetical protein
VATCRRFRTVHDIVGGWRNVLPAGRQRSLDAGVAEFGAANDRHFHIYGYAKSPRSSEEMHSAGVETTITFLSDRDPSADENSAGETTALAGEFRTAVSKDPVAYSRSALEIPQLAPIFVSRFLEAMDTPAFNAGHFSRTARRNETRQAGPRACRSHKGELDQVKGRVPWRVRELRPDDDMAKAGPETASPIIVGGASP